MSTLAIITPIDYRDDVTAILRDQSLTGEQKLTQQTELFGWTEPLEEFITNPPIVDPETGEITYDNSDDTIIDTILKTVGLISSEPLLNETEGNEAWDAYLLNYMTNYQPVIVI
jgi:hypothetical protein